MANLEEVKTRTRGIVDAATAEAREKLAEAILQYGFLRANWGKVSTIVVGGVAVGFLLGAWLF